MKSKLIENVSASLRVDIQNTFANFKDEPGTAPVVKAVKGVIDGVRPIAMICGGVGNGKTHLLHAAAIELYHRGKFARVMNYTDMLDLLKRSIDDPNLDYNDILKGYCDAERLIIDDIGAGGSDTEFGDKILETIVCARYGRELLTIMTTNRDIETLPERVLSRLKDKSTSYLVINKGTDYRLKK